MTESEAQNHETDSVGGILKFLRNRENLSVQEVATRLHLEPRIIESLEHDAYDQLPASIYVRGYIRNYSKLVGADAEHLIRLYDQADVEEEPEIIPEVRHPAQTSSSDKPVKVVTYLISLILVILLIAWWQSNFLIKDLGVAAGKAAAPAAAGKESTTEAPAFDYHFDVVPGSTNPFYRAKQEQEPAAAAATEEGAPEVKPEEGPVDTTEAATPPPPREPRTIISNTTGPDTIRMQLTADSWIEVTDADGQRVFFSLGRAGDTLILHGTAPFSVLLGYAQGVKMEYNGQPFDLATYSRSGVSHFTLGRPHAEEQPQTPGAEQPSPGAEQPSPGAEQPSPGTEEP
jgi:cytoskeleton protein RodZ